MNRVCVFVVGWVAMIILTSAVQATTLYAKVDGVDGSADYCLTWATACSLDHALTMAVANDQVWVKAGTYSPFALKDGVKVIGGFAGTEILASQSNPTTNVTIVDGNGSRCVSSEDHNANPMLRGFKVINGYDADDFGGGGLLLRSSNVLIVQCIFENNAAKYVGGAVMVIGQSSPQFINCTFRNNGVTPLYDTIGGGAVFIYEASSSTFVNCLFHDNKAWEGGAVSLGPEDTAVFRNCTLANNQATLRDGGAIYNAEGVLVLRNCILWGNKRINFGVTYDDQIVNYGSADISYSDIQGGWAGTGNINADPLFTNPSAGNYTIPTSSPCKNLGSNNDLPVDVADLDWDGNTSEVLPKDLAPLIRIRLTIVDIGAYEAFGSGGGGGQ